MLKNNKGFSLIELMVVVAIIAILSTIAIPSFQVFQAKARQKEGFSLLGAYFNAAQASRIEYGFFKGEFPATGFAPNGQLGYRLVAMDNPTDLPYMQAEFGMCVTTGLAMGAAACPTGFIEWAEGPMGSNMAGSQMIGWAAPVAMGINATATTFQVNAAGVVSLKAANIDEYQIDQDKSLSMVTDGLK